MTPSLLFPFVGAGLIVIALHALILRRHLLRKILALNIMSSGVFLVLSSVGRAMPGEGPDPVPHALVITGIVIAVAATALALTLMLRVQTETGRARLPAPPAESTDDRAGR